MQGFRVMFWAQGPCRTLHVIILVVQALGPQALKRVGSKKEAHQFCPS